MGAGGSAGQQRRAQAGTAEAGRCKDKGASNLGKPYTSARAPDAARAGGSATFIQLIQLGPALQPLSCPAVPGTVYCCSLPRWALRPNVRIPPCLYVPTMQLHLTSNTLPLPHSSPPLPPPPLPSATYHTLHTAPLTALCTRVTHRKEVGRHLLHQRRSSTH